MPRPITNFVDVRELEIRSFADLRLPPPCDQDWEQMPRVGEEGRHCAKCQHTVYDFTDKTPADYNRIVRAVGGKICGNYYLDQLYPPQEIELTGWLRRPRLLLASLLTVLKLQAQPGYAAPAASPCTEQPPAAVPADAVPVPAAVAGPVSADTTDWPAVSETPPPAKPKQHLLRVYKDRGRTVYKSLIFRWGPVFGGTRSRYFHLRSRFPFFAFGRPPRMRTRS